MDDIFWDDLASPIFASGEEAYQYAMLDWLIEQWMLGNLESLA